MVGRDMLALNLPQKEMEALCVKQLEAGDAIWFACDAGAYGARKEGVWDPESVCCEALLADFQQLCPKAGASSITAVRQRMHDPCRRSF